MSGYLNFDITGDEKIDAIVDILNQAGDGFHHTEDWNEPMSGYGGRSYIDLIQEAFNNAATKVRTK